jgi:hypothetical protein
LEEGAFTEQNPAENSQEQFISYLHKDSFSENNMLGNSGDKPNATPNNWNLEREYLKLLSSSGEKFGHQNKHQTEEDLNNRDLLKIQDEVTVLIYRMKFIHRIMIEIQ